MLYPIKIEFNDYPSGSWEDWSEYLVEVSQINKSIESDNPGEAGTIVFDNTNVSFRYESGNPVYNKFSINLTNIIRYLFRISIPKADGTYVLKFEGVCDFSTIKWNEFENEISFEIIDKISALRLLTSEQCRTTYLIKDRLYISNPLCVGYEFEYLGNIHNSIWISGYVLFTYVDLSSIVVNVGDVVDIPEIVGGQSKLRVITKSYLAFHDGHVANYVEFTPPLDATAYNSFKFSDTDYYTHDWNLHISYDKLFYGIDINNINNGELISLNGLLIIQALYNQAWPGTNLIVKPAGLTYTIPMEYAVRLTKNNPFGKEPLDAFISLINSFMPASESLSGAYAYVNEQGDLVLQARFGLTSGTQREIGNSWLVNRKRKYFWDKLADGATVKLISWIIDKQTGDYLTAEATSTLKPPGMTGFIKPRNEIKKELITNETPSMGQDPKEFLLDAARSLAEDILAFYGKRREAINYLLDLDDNTITWDILDHLTLLNKNYFLTKLIIDPLSRLLEIEAVSVDAYEFDTRSVVVPVASNLSDSSTSTVSTINISSSNYNFWEPLSLEFGTVKLNYTDNFKLVNNKLDTVQDILTTSSPTFAQLALSNAGTTITNAVRADRTINTSAPLTGGGNLTTDRTLGLFYNTTNLKLTSNALNTIQDIATTSSPTFATIKLTNLTDGYLPYHISDTSGLSNSPILTNGTSISVGGPINTSFIAKFYSDIETTKAIKAETITGAYISQNVWQNYTKGSSNGIGLSANRLFGATMGRYTITATGFTGNLYYLFDGFYENSANISPGSTAVLEINFNPQVGWSPNSVGGYTYTNGLLAFTTYNTTGYSLKVEYYRYNTTTGLDEWYTLLDTTTIDKNPYIIDSAGGVYVKKIKLTFTNNSETNPLPLTEIEWFITREKSLVETNTMASLPRFYPSDLTVGYTNLIFKNTSWQNALVIDNNSNLLFYNGTKKIGSGDNNPFQIVQNNQNVIYINNSKNVGIRTTNPKAEFHNNGDYYGRGRISLHSYEGDGNSGTAYLQARDDSGTSSINLQIRTQNNGNIINALRLLADGKVGIYTTNPSYILDVNGTGRFVSTLVLDNVLEQKGTSGANLFYTDIQHFGNKSIGTNPFVSGWTGSGWRIDKGITATNRTHLELDDITVRGTMRVYELIINQIRATNGSLFVSSSAKVLSSSLQGIEPEIYTLIFEDPEGHGVCPFLENDIILVQRVRLDSATMVKQIICQITSVTGTTVTANVIYRNGTIDKNDLCVRIGNTTNTARQGSVYLTSDDSNAPYIDVSDEVNSWSAWSSFNKLKVRLGKLSGITDSYFGALSGYGLYAKSNAYLRGKIYAEQGGWIAGWTINSDDLSSPLISHNYQLKLVANNTNSIVGAYLDIGIGGGNPLYLSFGKIKRNLTTYDDKWGLSLKDENGNDFFELSDSVKHIAGWNFDSQKFYKSTNIELNSATNTIGVNSNKVKLFHTDSDNWGLEGRDASNNLVFQLGSTNKIAGWNFIPEHIYKLTSGTPSSSPSYGLTISATSSASVVIAYGSNWQRYVKFGYQTSGNWFGLEGTDSSGNLIFQLGSTNKISNWSFDSNKLYSGLSTKGISLNTSSTPFITGTTSIGFEVYDSSNPKLFIGKKDGNFLDWNITDENSLTIKGNIIGGTIAIGSGNEIFKVDSSGLYLGNSAYSSAPFRVSMSGDVIASSLATSNNTQRVRLQNDKLIFDSDVTNNYVEIQGFSSGNGIGIRLGSNSAPISGSWYGVYGHTYNIIRDSSTNNYLRIDTRNSGYIEITALGSANGTAIQITTTNSGGSMRGIRIDGTGLKYWNGSTWATIQSW